MAFTRRNTDDDATWARAWTADALVDLASIAAIVGPARPHHGDIAFVTATGFYYLWMDDDTWAQLPENSIPTVAQGDLLYGSAAGVISTLAKDANATRYLSNQGTSNNPSWNQVNLANGVTGDLPDANLTANVPLKDAANVFSAQNEFTSGLRELGRSVNLGFWQAVAFSAGDFTANGAMTWTVASGDISGNSYTLIGKTLFWNIAINTTTVGGTPNTELRVTLPAGLITASYTLIIPTFCLDNNVADTLARADTSPGQTYVRIFHPLGTNWSLATDVTYIYFNLVVEIQ